MTVDRLDIYTLYPFHGSFQQLFNGTKIKYLLLKSVRIRSDLSESFTGNIARLDLVRQVSELSVENFPPYPVHKLIINAFYVDDFDHEHPPNYTNLHHLRVHSYEPIPPTAFRHYSLIQTLEI